MHQYDDDGLLPAFPRGWLALDSVTFVESDFGAGHYDSTPGHSRAALSWVRKNRPDLLPDGRTGRGLEEGARAVMFQLGLARIASTLQELAIEGDARACQLEAAVRRGIADETDVAHVRGSVRRKLYDAKRK